MREEVADFLHYCRIERRLSEMTCKAYERDVRAWLEGDGRRIDSAARKRRRFAGLTSPTVTIPSRSRNAMQAPTSRS